MSRFPAALPSQLGVRPAAALTASFLSQAFLWMFVGLGLTALVTFVVASSPALVEAAAGLYLFVALGQLALVVAIGWLMPRMSATLGLLLFFIYSASVGLTMAIILLAYGLGSATAAFTTASATFGGAALYGAATKRSLAGMGGYLTMGLIGLLAALLVNLLLLRSGPFDLLLSIVGVVLFVGLTAWDVQKISRGDYAAAMGSMEKGAVVAALALYLDFLNIFLFLLRIFGRSRD